MMETSFYHGTKGQAGLLDLAVFILLSTIALSYLTIQASRSLASTEFVEENENINEIAVTSLRSLLRSRADLEISTLQPVAIKPLDSDFSESIEKTLQYFDAAIRKLDEGERALSCLGKDPDLAFVRASLDQVDLYTNIIQDLLTNAIEKEFEDTRVAGADVCDIISLISGMMPGYSDIDAACGGNITRNLVHAVIGDTAGIHTTLSLLSKDLSKNPASEEVAGELQKLRCELSDARKKLNSILTYLTVGVDTQVSFLELLPLNLDLRDKTIEELLKHSLIVGDSFLSTDAARSIITASALMVLRNKKLPLPFNITDRGEVVRIKGARTEREDLLLVPHSPLFSTTNTTAEAPYSSLLFDVAAYLTGSKRLAIRMKILGEEAMGTKQKTNYFNGMDYLLNTPAYRAAKHTRTYSGAHIQGRVTERPISITNHTWIDDAQSYGVLSETRHSEVRIIRPMEAHVSFTYENTTWPEETYSFDVHHFRISENSNYTINTSLQKREYNQSDVAKSLILGALLTSRSGLMDRTKECIEKRLDDLILPYHYRFELKDCCHIWMDITKGTEPEGRRGVAKYRLMGDGINAEVVLTVWR